MRCIMLVLKRDKTKQNHNRYVTDSHSKARLKQLIYKFIVDCIIDNDEIITQLKPFLQIYIMCKACSEESSMFHEIVVYYEHLYDEICNKSQGKGISVKELEGVSISFLISELLRVRNNQYQYEEWVTETIPLECDAYKKYKGAQRLFELIREVNKRIPAEDKYSIQDDDWNIVAYSGSRSQKLFGDEETDKKARAECSRRLRFLKGKKTISSSERDEISQIEKYLRTPEYATLTKKKSAPYSRKKMSLNRFFENTIPHIPYPKAIFDRHYDYSDNEGGMTLNFSQTKNIYKQKEIPEVHIATVGYEHESDKSIWRNFVEPALCKPLQYFIFPADSLFPTFAALVRDYLQLQDDLFAAPLVRQMDDDWKLYWVDVQIELSKEMPDLKYQKIQEVIVDFMRAIFEGDKTQIEEAWDSLIDCDLAIKEAELWVARGGKLTEFLSKIKASILSENMPYRGKD